MGSRLEELLIKCRGSVVSFDVFDTALRRTVFKPADIFLLTQARMRAAHPGFEKNFYRDRIAAETEARTLAAGLSRQEVTFEEIYSCLSSSFGYTEDECLTLKEMELQTETESSTADPVILELYKRLLKAGKRVIFISDMYLPSGFIKRLLHNAGYDRYELLLVSSELQKTKWTGESFTHALDCLSISGDQMTHVGDNRESDWISPRRLGIASVEWFKLADLARQVDWFRQIEDLYAGERGEDPWSGILLQVIAEEALSADRRKIWEMIGRCVAAPIYYGFARWLMSEVSSSGINRLYFLSRDGHVMNKAFRILQECEGTHGQVTCSYLFASRRAINFPMMREHDDVSIPFLMSGTLLRTAGGYLERIGIDPSLYGKVFRAAGFRSARQRIRSHDDFKKLHKVFCSMEGVVLEKARSERVRMEKYLEQEGFFSSGNAAVIDIGWHGSLQRSLCRLLDERGQGNQGLAGYYLATYAHAWRPEGGNTSLKGYILDYGKPEENMDILMASIEFYEFLHLAPHGTVTGYEQTESGIVARCEDTARFLGEHAHAETVQTNALDVVGKICRRAPGYLPVPEAGAVLMPSRRLLLNPSFDEADLIGRLGHADGFGGSYRVRPLACPGIFLDFMFRPGKVVERYENSYWKPGYRSLLSASRVRNGLFWRVIYPSYIAAKSENRSALLLMLKKIAKFFVHKARACIPARTR